MGTVWIAVVTHALAAALGVAGGMWEQRQRTYRRHAAAFERDVHDPAQVARFLALVERQPAEPDELTVERVDQLAAEVERRHGMGRLLRRRKRRP